MKRTGNRRPTRKPGLASNNGLASFADILPAVYGNLDLDKRVNELALLALWPQQVATIAGESAGAQSKALRLKKQGERLVLVVKVAHAALASELGFHVPDLKEALNRFTPQTGLTVDQIQITVGSL